MLDYTSLIIIQSLFVLMFIILLKLNNSDTPDFDYWLNRIMQYNPALNIEDAFDEYIRTYNIAVIHEANEPENISQARAKLQLIEQYNIDDVLAENDQYQNFRISLEKTLR